MIKAPKGIAYWYIDDKTKNGVLGKMHRIGRKRNLLNFRKWQILNLMIMTSLQCISNVVRVIWWQCHPSATE